MFISKNTLREILLRLERLERIAAGDRDLPPLPLTRAGPVCASRTILGHDFDSKHICRGRGLKAAGAP